MINSSDNNAEIQGRMTHELPDTDKVSEDTGVGLIPGVIEKQASRQKQQTIYDNSQYSQQMLNDDDDVSLKSVPDSILEELTIQPIPDKHLSRARNRQSLFLHKRRQSKNRKIVAKRTNFFFKLFTAIVLMAGLWFFLTAHFWFLTPSQIQIQHTGNGFGFIQDTEIIRVIRPSLKYPLYSLAPEKLSAILKKRFPQIAAVSVRRRLFPLRLDVMITEKPIWGVLFHLSPGGTFSPSAIEAEIQHTFDAAPDSVAYHNAGVLHPNERPSYIPTAKLSISQQKVLQHKPVIVTQKQRLNEKQFDNLQQTLALIQAGQAKLNPYKTVLQWVDARDPEDTYLYFSTFKIHAGPIDPLLKDRVSRLFEVLPLIEEQKDNIEYVDLAWRNQMTFKMLKNIQGQLSNASPKP